MLNDLSEIPCPECGKGLATMYYVRCPACENLFVECAHCPLRVSVEELEARLDGKVGSSAEADCDA